MDFPLQPPELGYMISQNFNSKDLDRCSRVSKSWRHFFLPLLLQDRTFQLSPVNHPSPHMTFLRHYGRHIEHLGCKFARPLLDDRRPLFPNAQSLHIGTRQTEQDLAEMLPWVRHCPQLRSLRLQKVTAGHGATAPDWTLLATLQQLTELGVDARLSKASLEMLLRSCTHLTSLWLKGMRFERPAHNILVPRLGVMTVIDLIDCDVKDGPDTGLICRHILCSSPNLVTFTWPTLVVDHLERSTGQGNAAGEIAPSVGAWACVTLRVLRINYLQWSTSAQRNGVMMEQLRRLPELTHLSVNGMANGGAQWRTGSFNRYVLTVDPRLRWMVTAWPLIQNYTLKYVL